MLILRSAKLRDGQSFIRVVMTHRVDNRYYVLVETTIGRLVWTYHEF